MSRINRMIVRLFEKPQAKPVKRPTEIVGLSWHLPGSQHRMCVVCKQVMAAKMPPLIGGRLCGPCYIATDPPHDDAA